MNRSKIILIIIFSCITVFSSCSQPTFKVLEPSVKNGVTMEGKYWRGTFDPSGGFELRLTNSSNANIYNCTIIFDDKYRHTINGLFSLERGVLKDTVIKKDEQITLQFSDAISNLLYFEISEKNYIPTVIAIKCDNCDVKWNMKK